MEIVSKNYVFELNFNSVGNELYPRFGLHTFSKGEILRSHNFYITKALFALAIISSSALSNSQERAEATVLSFSGNAYQNTVVALTDDTNVKQSDYVNASYDNTEGIIMPVSATGTYSIGFGSYIPEFYTGPGTLYLHEVLVTNQDGTVLLEESFDGWSQDSTTTTGNVTRSEFSTDDNISWSTYADSTDIYNGGGAAFAAVDSAGDKGMVYPLDGGGPFSVLIRTVITVPENTTELRVKVNWRYSVSIFSSGDPRLFTIGLQSGAVPPESLFSFSAPPVTNNPPAISGSPETSVVSGVAYSFTPEASDIDSSDTLTFSITNKPTWASFSTTTGALTGTPTNDDVGSVANIVISVSDGSLSASLPAFNITVTNVNQAPAITGTPSTTVAQDSAYSFTPTATDVDSGDTLTFSIINKPTWASFSSSTGQLSGTPTNDDVGSTAGIIITVTDNANLSDSLAAFTLSVTNVNDAPVITGTPSTSVAQDSAYSFTPTVTDVDSGDTTTFSITNKPTWASFSTTTGALTGTPTNDDVGVTSNIVVTVSDSANATASLAAFAITVTNVNDAPVAVNDSFTLSFSETNTYALDVLANDTDIDEEILTISSANAAVGSVSVVDGMLMYSAQGNTQGEIALSYRITDAAGASSQADVALSLSQNDNAPVITVPADIDAPATGLFTKVDLGVATAMDSEGNTLAVSIVNNTQRFAPGKHVIFWRTVDGAGQETVASQKVNIQPLVSLSKDAIVGEENTSAFSVLLNGPAPAYPVVVPYEVSGSADGTDHDVISGEVIINSGTQASVTFNVFGDGQDEGNEDIIITLAGDINVGAKNSTTITIVEDNVAPTISTQVRQGDDIRSLVTIGGNDVVITATTTDVNPLDNVSVTWSSENDNLVNISNVDNEFVLATTALASGIYKITVTASDDASPSLSTRQDVYVEVVDTLATLTSRDSDGDLIPDDVEGFTDSDNDGIPDYLDNISECNVLPAQVANSAEFLVEGDPGVCLRIGTTVAQNQSGGAEIFTNEVSGDSAALNMGGLFDFIATGLPKAGDSYRITLPQRLPIPSAAIYRKLTDGEWVDFVVDDNNAIYSAPGDAGFCPPPGGDEWTAGLNEGDWCVLLDIQDGGPNDDDGAANRSIVDPGGVAVLLSDNDLPQVNSDSAVVGAGQTITVDVLANDTDANDDTLTISAASVDFGNVMIDDNQLTYTPPMGFVGAATIIYSVTDGQGGTGANTLTVNVVLNTAPTVNDDSASTDDRTTIGIDVLANDSDADGDTLTVISVSANQGRVNINPDGSVLYTPRTGFEGTDVITYEVADGKQGISTGQVRVNVVAFKAATIENESSGGSMGGVWLLLLSAIGLGRRYIGTRPANFVRKSPSRTLPVMSAAALSVAAITGAYAQTLPEGISIEATVGQAKANTSLPMLGNEVRSTRIEEDDTSWSLGAYYDLSPTWQVGARYIELGQGNATLDIESTAPSKVFGQLNEYVPVLTSGVALQVGYHLPEYNDWRSQVFVGALHYRLDVTSTLVEAAKTVVTEQQNTKLFAGAQAGYPITDNMQLFIRYTHFTVESETAKDISVGVKFSF